MTKRKHCFLGKNFACATTVLLGTRMDVTTPGARDEDGLDEGLREGAAGGAQDECQTLLHSLLGLSLIHI